MSKTEFDLEVLRRKQAQRREHQQKAASRGRKKELGMIQHNGKWIILTTRSVPIIGSPLPPLRLGVCSGECHPVTRKSMRCRLNTKRPWRRSDAGARDNRDAKPLTSLTSLTAPSAAAPRISKGRTTWQQNVNRQWQRRNGNRSAGAPSMKRMTSRGC
jgi:hypothetical protein